MIEIQRQMLIVIKQKTGLTETKICEIMGYGINSFNGWKNKRNEMPLSKMHDIITQFNLNYCQIYYLALENMSNDIKRSA